MNGFADAVRSRLTPSCLVDGVDSIDKGKCGASLAEAPHPRVIVDLDETGSPRGPTNVKCDFLFFAGPGWVAPIEIKDGEPNVAQATKQLQAGAKAAESLVPHGLATEFRPVLVSKSLRRHKRNELRDVVVEFRGSRERIRRLACEDPLTEALGTS